MEQRFQNAIDLGDITNAVLTAQDASGRFHYAKAFGERTLLDGTKKAAQADDIMNIFSCTKLLTTVAIMQCVESGRLSLEEDVYTILPELKDARVLTGYGEDGEPQYEDRAQPVTLSSLLTHSSGYTYDVMHPHLLKWRASRGEVPMSGPTVESRANIPLVFQPGTNWSYGYGMEWAGKLLERVLDTTLEVYFHEHLFRPLGIVDATFWPWGKENIRQRMVELNPMDPKGAGTAGTGGYDMGTEHTDCFGGAGMYMTLVDYLKVLHSLLVNDGKLLKPETVDLMFEPHLSNEAHEKLNSQLQEPGFNEYFGQGVPEGKKRDYGYGGMLIQEALPGWYQQGTMVWAGSVNLTWFIDRKAGLCGIEGSQPTLQEAPAKRKPGEEPKPTREGGMVWEAMTSHIKQIYRKGIYETFAEWQRRQ